MDFRFDMNEDVMKGEMTADSINRIESFVMIKKR